MIAVLGRGGGGIAAEGAAGALVVGCSKAEFVCTVAAAGAVCAWVTYGERATTHTASPNNFLMEFIFSFFG
jgi:hypothetical protein